MITYGINSKDNGYLDTSKTERGAKNHASRNGYKEVYARFNCGMDVILVSKNVNGRWVKIN